jgi:hypothetical protein
MDYHYPPGTVRDLLNTETVTDVTRQALTERLEQQPRQPTFFNTDEFALLSCITDRLLPQDNPAGHIDIAGTIDERLTGNKSDGWRYDSMPNDRDAYRLGLKATDESAIALYGASFCELPTEQQDEVLNAVQAGTPPGITWKQIPASRFFEELFAEAVNAFYSHPLGQEEIGYVGMADVPTWQRLKLNDLEPREPRPID